MKQLRTSLDFRRICVASDLCFGVAGGFSFHKASEEQRNRPEKSLQTAYSGKFQKLLTNCYKYIHNIMIKAWYHVYIACILQYIILHSSENSQIDSKNVELGAVVPYNLYMATLSCQVYWGSPILHRFLLASSINSYQFANCFMSLKYAPTESFRFALRRVTRVFQVGPWKHLQRGVPWPCPNVHGTLVRTSLWCLFSQMSPECHLNVTICLDCFDLSRNPLEIH